MKRSALTVVAGALLLGQGLPAQAAGHRDVVYRGPTGDPTIALTFDDGYAPQRCLEIADILTAHRVPATWFPNGIHVAAAPSVWRSIAKRFPIGNHTLHHPSLVGLPAARIKRELRSNESIIERVTGRPMVPILRPTFGAFDGRVLRVARNLGYRVVLWDVTAADTSPRGTDHGVAANALKGGNGSIILMHCGPEVTPRILPIVIARYACAGYRFATLPALLAGRAGKRARVDCPAPKLPAKVRPGAKPAPTATRGDRTPKPGSRQDTGPKPESSAPPASHASTALEPFYAQTATWTTCADPSLECATIDVPLDDGHPEAGRVEVAVYRLRAPGGSGTPLLVDAGDAGAAVGTRLSTFASGAGQALSAGYDLVGSEVRGAQDGTSATDRVDADESAARDLDILRAVLGQERLDFYGASSGVSLGAVYATLFPEHVGRMVLDGPVGDETVGDRRSVLRATTGDPDRRPAEATPIVIIEATTDPADPLSWAGALEGQQPHSSIHIHVDGTGGTGYGVGSSCIDDAVNAYFLEGLLPQDGLAC